MNNSRPEAGDPLSIFNRVSSRPVASPVSTYAAPERKDGKGAALMGALSQLDEAFRPVLSSAYKSAVEKEEAEGQEAFAKSREKFAEAVSNGTLPAGASPFVRRGWRKAELGALGAEFNLGLARALEESNLGQTSDPAAVRQFAADYQRQFESENGIDQMPVKEVAEFFRPSADRALDSFYGRQLEQNIAYAEQSRVRGLEREVLAAVGMGSIDGSSSGQLRTSAEMGRFLNEKAAELQAEGVDPATIEKVLIGAVSQAAIEHGNPEVLDALDSVSIYGSPLGASLGTVEARDRVEDAIRIMEDRKSTAAEKAVKAEREAATEDVMRRAAEADRAGDQDEAERIASELATKDPEKYRVWQNWTEERRKSRDAKSDDISFGATRMGVMRAESLQDAYAMIEEDAGYGRITMEQRNQLRSFAADRFNPGPNADVIRTIEGDSLFKGAVDGVRGVITAGNMGINDPESEARVQASEQQLMDASLAWMWKNRDEDGNYDRIAYRDFINEQSKMLREDAAPSAELQRVEAEMAEASDGKVSLEDAAGELSGFFQGTLKGGRIRQKLIDRGLSPEVAEGFVDNLQDESGLNSGINEANPIVPGSRGGFGLGQWTGVRRRRLEAYAALRGVPPSDEDMQLDFLMMELRGTERTAASHILGATSRGEAGAAIVTHFLRPAKEHRERRAAKYLNTPDDWDQ